MNKQPSTEGPDKGGSWEESVSRFLEQTPDYFLRHPELLAALVVPHPESGRAVSLVERQVRVLRDRNEVMARELRELLQIARDNDQLGERVQRFALAMIDAGSVDDALDTAHDMLRQDFSLEGVAVRIAGNPRPAHARAEFVEPGDAALDRLLIRLGERNGQPVCGPAQDAEALEKLFGAQAPEIRSRAVIALTRRGLRGALVLGSHDPQRFRPEMGTLYLTRLGDLLMAGIARHLVAVSG
jgi:uncharacterized protein YigA (DUF484 family)